MTVEKMNRRRGPDIIIKSIKFIVAFSWIVIIALFVVFTIAKPRVDGMYLGDKTITGADTGVIQYAFYLMIFQVVLCTIGVIISASRLKRKTDKLNLSLIVFGSLSILGIIIYSIIGP